MLLERFYIVGVLIGFYFFFNLQHIYFIFPILIIRSPYCEIPPLKMINTPNFSDLIKQSRPTIFLGILQKNRKQSSIFHQKLLFIFNLLLLPTRTNSSRKNKKLDSCTKVFKYFEWSNSNTFLTSCIHPKAT